MLYPVILSELIDSDDERPSRGKTREWLKRRSELGAYSTIVKELIIDSSTESSELSLFMLSSAIFAPKLRFVFFFNKNSKQNKTK